MLRLTQNSSDTRRAGSIRGARTAGLAATVLLAGGLLAGCATTVNPTSAVDPDATATAAPEASASATPDSGKPTDETGKTDKTETGKTEGSDESDAGVGTDPMDPVDVGKGVVVEDGTVVWVTKISDVSVEGTGPGEINGPGVAVTLKIKNGSTTSLDLNGTAVSAYFGDLPASLSSAAPTDLLAGVLKPGKSATGTYVFMKPAGASAQVHVEVENTAWPQIVKVEQ